MASCAKLTIAEGMRQLPTPDGARSVGLFRHGTLQVKLAALRTTNEQTPHEQDEVYVIMAGAGFLRCEGDRKPFAAGDLIFVPARAQHRFEDFTDDLTVWVLFYGPTGGES
jgi:mannose-6-phosphate isomerase-like protein (cupin superfamily)